MRIPLSMSFIALASSTAVAQGAAVLHPSSEMHWVSGPPTLPKGAQMVVLEGDPSRAGVFTMRIKFPAGMRVSPHWHTQTEHATVLAGVLHIGMGSTFDKSATKPLAAGSFGYWPAGMKHFAWMEGETVLQLHGQGPWTITYVNPADDPRKPAK